MRLFIALPLPHELQNQLDLWWSVESSLLPGWRAMPARNRHLTLHFLGDVNGKRLAKLSDTLSELFDNTPAMSLSLHGMGFFPSLSKAKVFWVGIHEETGALASCVRSCRHLCQPIQGRGEKASRFRAHITMARHADKVNVSEPLIHLADPAEFHWFTEEAHLIQSQLHPHGASYQVVESFTLAGEA